MKMATTKATSHSIGAALGVAALSFGLYAPVLGFDFVSFDDGAVVRNNPLVTGGLALESLARAFTSSPVANWQPLTWISHMIDVELFGLDARGHHATSALLHALNAALLLLLFHRLTGALARSAAIALLFAIHPLHVESVAWIAERKDVLSTAFGLLALLAYSSWAQRGRWPSYAAALWFAALSLLSKATLVTLPFILLLLDYWPLERLTRARALRCCVEKLPFLALSIAASLATLWAQGEAGAFENSAEVGLGARFANAVWSYGVYLYQTVWPVDLAVFYPHPYILLDAGGPPGGWAVAGVAALLVAVTLIFARLRGRRYAIVGWLWFVGTLVPMIGIVQVGSQAHADRYTYVPLIGIFLAVVWGAADLSRRLPVRTGRVLVAAELAVLCALSALCWTQIHVWRDAESLLRHTLEVTPRNPQMRHGYARFLESAGRPEEAAAQLRRSLETWPDFAEAQELLGQLAGRLPHRSALDAYRRALRASPRDADLHAQLADALVVGGDPETAIPHYRQALAANPAHAQARHALARTMRRLGRRRAAIRNYRLLLETDPLNIEALEELANLLNEVGNPESADELQERLKKLNPR